jgi:hypothetical protein
VKKSTNATLNLPIAEVEALALKSAIVDKFGSLAHFCRLTQRNLQDVNVALRKKTAGNTDFLNAIKEEARTKKAGPAPGYHFTDSHKKKLRDALNRFGTATDFCQKYPQFSSQFISRITNEGLQRITKKARALASILSVELV